MISFSHSYDNPRFEPCRGSTSNRAAIGVSASWKPWAWKLAILAFAIAWAMQGWEGSRLFLGPTRINYLTQDLWKGLVTLACCYAVFQISKRRAKTGGLILSLVIAATALTARSL
jgi:hypothetical protein